MSDTRKTPERINFIVDPELRQMIKRWRHQNEIDTEGEAVRELLRRQLQAEQTVAA
jgi:hypothetical protein